MPIDVSTPVYEGPFDLLLQLILSSEVELYDIDLAHIVDAYLAELERLQALDLDVATEFLLIAATLVELKTRRLLPGTDDGDLDEELALWEERDLLLARLLECKTFKDVAAVLARLSDEADLHVARTVGPDERFAGLAPDLIDESSVARLRSAAIRALTPKPVPTVDLFHVTPITTTVADAITEILDELPRAKTVSFRRLTSALVDRIEVIIRFLAVLELYKQGVVEIDQFERFGDLTLRWVGDDDYDPLLTSIDAYEG